MTQAGLSAAAAPGRPVAFTVDVEPDWGVGGTRAVQEAWPPLLRLLDERGISATFFVVGRLAEECREQVAAAAERHEIGSHGHTHALLSHLPEHEVAGELARSKAALETLAGPVAGVRAPYFRTPPNWERLVLEAGYSYDASAGSVWPSPRNRRRPSAGTTGSGLTVLPTSHMRDGWTPFSLTMLRAYGRAWRWFRPAAPTMFYMHLHELIEPDGLGILPPWLRPVQRRNAGPRAWELLRQLLDTPGFRFVSCRGFIAEQTTEGGGV